MFIKRLELFGFKTFAEKTEIDLSDGITAIVGPNGCGKSNIADALLWVLGEANVRNLRGQRAIDVIFSGSEKRRALGVGEVSLTLDNSCRTLPIDFSEVTVTRRTYRSGEGEYFINKARCRLKDIYELFLDTGIGREAYSMVTQGEIDAVLSARPEDRRELFEEAAGVKKYRYRRQEALKKLERTECNLRRVHDIMSEIGSQLEPLAQQAEQAVRYNELASRLREIEIDLLVRDLRRYAEALEEVRQTKEGSADRIAQYDRLLSELELEKDKRATESQKIEEELEAARRVQASVSGNVQRLEGRIALLEEKMNSAASERSRLDDDVRAIERRIEDYGRRIEDLAREQEMCAESERRLAQEAAAKSAQLRETESQFENASRAVSDQKATYLELARELAAKRNALQNSRERAAQLEAALRKLTQQLGELERQKSEADEAHWNAAQQASSLENQVAELAVQAERLAQECSRTEAEAAESAARHSETVRELAASGSRLNTLREMAEAHEGFYEGVRSVMAASKSGKLCGGFAVAADVIDVPRGLETAIETALGSSLQDIVADSVDGAKAAIAFLKANRAGRATFLPLDGLRPPPDQVQGDLRGAGTLGLAADLVRCEAKYEPAVRLLLGRTVVADNIDHAVRLSRALRGWSRIVTTEGELIAPSGAMTGGLARSREQGFLLRKQEIASLTSQIAGLEKAARDLASRHDSAEASLAELRTKSSDAARLLAERRVSLAEHKRRAEFAAEEAGRIARQIEGVSVEKNEAERLLAEESARIAALQDDLQSAGRQDADLDQRVSGAEQDVEELQRRLETARADVARIDVERAALAERLSALNAAAAEVRSARDEMMSALAARHSQMDGLAIDVAALLDERQTVESECERQRELLRAADSRFSELVARRNAEQEQAAQVDARLRETSRLRNQLAADTHDDDVREARLEVQVSQTADRLLQEYDITIERAVGWPEEIEVQRGTATEVARLRREIREMGPVNTGAVQEYDRIKQRWDFLSAQRADLEAARDQVNHAISEIDTSTRDLFMDTFNAVAENFDLMFRRLFGGGKAQISLTNPNDLLETGIDITAQPPGKRLQDLTLLSGGERALAATALIFALLMAKPSPFVVMDEVDAPLDETNVERFALVLKEFAANSQFIVITHNRATMEAADSLYGVTMEEPGVSKMISVRLAAEEPTSVEELAEASAEEVRAVRS